MPRIYPTIDSDFDDFDIPREIRGIQNRDTRFRPDDSDYEVTAKYSDGTRRVRYQRDWSNPNNRY